MGHTITLDLSDDLYEALRQSAAKSGHTPEQTAAECLSKHLQPPAEDPLIALAGVLDSDLHDVAERHDYYLGQRLVDRLRSHDDS